MLLILFGNTARMGYECRKILQEHGYTQIKKTIHVPQQSNLLVIPRRNTTAEQAESCDYVYRIHDTTIGFNKKQFLNAVRGAENSYLVLSSDYPDLVEFIKALKLAYGDYVMVIYTYVDAFAMSEMVQEMGLVPEAEFRHRLESNAHNSKWFLENWELFDQLTIYGGENSPFDIASLRTQLTPILKRAEKTQRWLNNMNIVELPYFGPEDYVFVSYAHKDWNTVQYILEMLQHKGCRIWYDEGLKGGDDWRSVLRDKIRDCKNLLLISSQTACASPEVRWEVERAREDGTRIVNLRLDEAQFDGELGQFLQARQYVVYGSEDFHLRLLDGLDSSVFAPLPKQEE